MPTTFLALLVLSGAALYFMNPEERTRLLRSTVVFLRHALRVVTHRSEAGEPFDEFLRARSGWPVVTPLIIVVNVLVFMQMLADPQALDDAQRLIAWGGNFAPRTTNGEWWRLIAASFVHAGPLHLLTTIVAFVPMGIVLEGLVGRRTFAAVYLAAALLANVVSLWTTSATTVSVGASGAVFGIYGLLLASLSWSVISRSGVPFALITMTRTAAAAVPFLLYNLVTDHLGTASEMAGLATGFVGGLLVARGAIQEKPLVLRAAMVMAATMLIAAGATLPLRGVIDFRPEIAGVVAVEERTAGAYDVAAEKFKKGRLPAKALAQLIDRTIIPDLQAVRARIKAIRGVPREQAPLAAAADEYFRLREQSWRERIEGLLKSKMPMLHKAEQTERAALEALQKIAQL
jgi:rhomboid protease GluP